MGLSYLSDMATPFNTAEGDFYAAGSSNGAFGLR